MGGFKIVKTKLFWLIVIWCIISITALVLQVNVYSRIQDPCAEFHNKALDEVRKFERNENSSFATMYATMYLACREANR